MRERIINTAKDLFFAFGIRSVTMDDVARKSGISKKTLYANFPRKQVLAHEVVVSLLNWHRQLLEECRKEAADEILEVLMVSQTPFQTISTINPLFFYEVERFHQDAWQLIREYTRGALLTTVAQNLQSGIKNGYFRTDLDVDFTSKIRVEQIIAALYKMYDAGVSQKEMMRQYSEFYLHAIVTEEGNKLLMKHIKAKNELN